MQTLRTSLAFVFAGVAFAQFPGLTLPPSGNNQKAAVVQYIGPVRVTIDYSSPAVHGPDGKDRRGQIWGKLVPYGMSTVTFGNGKPAPEFLTIRVITGGTPSTVSVKLPAATDTDTANTPTPPALPQ